ncbi:selenide, water dikinase SelD [Chitinimonas sp. BJB300]|uniref:selenide, water dikinase SelD n=1 Tax=Chitinimonas sp. BJB300 TaxID=1559339 RepID=UPI000C11DA90|nr:selenide, water dikinase SelD [Chitinimonas sp. BJB300]PHV11742.1 selenide, water dikinase SelD [Chitinimonas sp. BJB300]TSJ90018.1 selenide, water dikinase SelD [Chitinimonas sp. BJB300]
MSIKLTQLSHGGGCGCKIAPAVLAEMLAKLPATQAFPQLLVGTETADDAAVYQINDQQAVIATTDFFMPIVDDPYDFGRIAATNAVSDIYAMGGTPIMALAIVGMPVNKLPVEAIQQILAGGAEVARQAGFPIAGGHSIDAPEPIYGLAVIGLVDPKRVKRNSAAQAGDRLILGKPLGIGILGSAMKKGLLDEPGYAALIATTTQLNQVGSTLAGLPGVHAMTDVTGFGLLGHLLEVCRGSKLTATLSSLSLPLLEAAIRFAQQGIGPGAIERNLASFGDAVTFAPTVADWQRRILADAQTSGGLLVSCAESEVEKVLQTFHQAGFHQAAEIGHLATGVAGIVVA